MLELAPYLTTMIGVSLLCALTWFRFRPDALARCMGAVVLVFIAGYGYGEVTGDYTHWAFNILTDAIAAFLILRHPAGKMQAALGGTYAVQLACHVAFGARDIWGVPDPVAYYDMLTIVAFVQLLTLGLWVGGIWGGIARDRLRDSRAKAYHWARSHGLGRFR